MTGQLRNATILNTTLSDFTQENQTVHSESWGEVIHR